MGLFSIFHRDPTVDWPPVPVPGYVKLDLYDREINGVPFGGAMALLERIGRPTNRQSMRHGRFIFGGLGLLVETEAGLVDYAGMCLDPEGDPGNGLTMANLTIVTPGREVHEVTPWTGAANIVAWMGEPMNLDEDEEESVLVYYLDGLTVEIECNTSLEVRWMSVYTSGADEPSSRHVRERRPLVGDGSDAAYTGGLGDLI